MTSDYEIDRVIHTINIPISLYQSIEGKYFVGQTKLLRFGDETYAWGGLINPENSKVRLYVNVFTVTNFSNKGILAEVWVDSTPVGKPYISNEISSTNTSLYPLAVPRVKLEYNKEILDTPLDGVNVFDRLVSPGTTVVAEEDGKYIISPGSSFIIFLKSSDYSAEACVAFEWWEEKYR